MTEPPRSLIYLPIIYLWTGGVEGNVLASLAPPVHLSGERLGWTLLVCVVSDFSRGHLEISWRSSSEDSVFIAPYSTVVTKRHCGHNPVGTITVATREWPSYSCSVSQRKHPKIRKRHRATSSSVTDKSCYKDEDEDEDREDIWTQRASDVQDNNKKSFFFSEQPERISALEDESCSHPWV